MNNQGNEANIPSGRTRVTKRVLTVLIGCLLLFPVALLSQAVAGAISLGIIVLFGSPLNFAPHPLFWFLMLVPLAAITGVYSGVVLSRYSLRVFPLRFKSGPRWIPVTCIMLVACVVTAHALYRRFYPIIDPSLPPPPGIWPFSTGLVVLWAQLGMVAFVYLRTDHLMEHNCILYLRRFRSFADRVTYRALLRSAPAGLRVIALVPADSSLRDLDPFVIGFSGFKFFSPIASMPLFVVAQDKDWQDTVQEFLNQADCVVVDGSAYSPSMAIEYNMLTRLSSKQKILVLFDDSVASPPKELETFKAIRYKRNFLSTIPKILIIIVIGLFYLYLSSRYPIQYPGILFWCILLVVPSFFQRSIQRQSVMSIRTSLRRLEQKHQE